MKGVGIAFALFDSLGVAIGNVFKTVNLSEVPENVICVLALALDPENLGEVLLLRDALHHLVDKLRLGERVFVIHGEMVQELIFSRTTVALVILPETEAANKIALSLVVFWRLSDAPIREFLEEPLRELGGTVVGRAEDSGQDGSSHPSLT